MTELNQQEALKILKSPDLFNIIVNDMKVSGFKGEYEELLLIYLTIISRLNGNGLYTCFIGSQSQGMDCFLSGIEKLATPGESLRLEQFSTNSFFYGHDMSNKCLLLSRLDKKGFLATLLKDKSLTRLTVADVNGEKRTVERKVDFSGSAFILADKKTADSLAGLFYFVKGNGSTADILLSADNRIDEIPAKHHAIQNCLKNLIAILPESIKTVLSFPSKEVRYRRDHQRFLDLISTVCFLRQYQKEVKYFNDGKEYIEMDSFDYETAYELFIYSAGLDESFVKGDLSDITAPQKVKETAD